MTDGNSAHEGTPIERLITAKIAEWRKRAAEDRADIDPEGCAELYEVCADELEAALHGAAQGTPQDERPQHPHIRARIGDCLARLEARPSPWNEASPLFKEVAAIIRGLEQQVLALEAESHPSLPASGPSDADCAICRQQGSAFGHWTWHNFCRAELNPIAFIGWLLTIPNQPPEIERVFDYVATVTGMDLEGVIRLTGPSGEPK